MDTCPPAPRALVVQWIEQTRPKGKMGVRFPPGAQAWQAGSRGFLNLRCRFDSYRGRKSFDPPVGGEIPLCGTIPLEGTHITVG